MKTHQVCAAALLGVTLLAAAGCKKKADADDASAGEKPTVSVQAEHPHYGAISEELSADAVLAPAAQAAIVPKIVSPVKRFYVQRGAHVRAGQLLATLENRDLAAAVADNRGSVTAAQGTFTNASASEVPQALTQARLDLRQARSTLKLDQSIASARKKLVDQGALAGRDFDTAQQTVVKDQAAVDLAQQKLTLLERAGSRAQIETAQGQLSSARGKLAEAEATLQYSEVRSPIAGVVTDRPLFAGETPAAGAPLLTVMDTATLIAKVHLAQAEAQQLKVGAAAELTIPGSDAPLPATVSLISPALDPSSATVEVWLRVDNRAEHLRPGSNVHATLAGRSFPHALLIPADAVERSADSGGHLVMVITGDGTAHRRTVITGVTKDGLTQILSGLNTGDMVITSGGYGLDEDSKVKVEAAEKKDSDGKPSAEDDGKSGAKP